MWLQEDKDAALEWIEYDDSLCSGCRNPRIESFDIANEDKYDVEALACHACAARERKGWIRNQNRDPDMPPLFGEFYAVSGPHRNGD